MQCSCCLNTRNTLTIRDWAKHFGLGKCNQLYVFSFLKMLFFELPLVSEDVTRDWIFSVCFPRSLKLINMIYFLYYCKMFIFHATFGFIF